MANIFETRFWVRSGIMLMAIMLVGSMAYATHLRAGNIIATRNNCNDRIFTITITVYTNTNGTSVLFGGTKLDEGDLLDFGDGSRKHLVPEIGPGKTPSGDGFSSTYEVIDAVRGIAKATYTIVHNYPGPKSYRISYREPNRNEGVLNMDQSVNTPFYLETVIVIDPFLGCNNTPNLLVPPIDRACSGVTWSHNPGAYDPDGDSLSYAFVIPFQEVDEPVLDYRDPDDEDFYIDFSTGNEQNDNTPTFNIDPITGTITWDAPEIVGEYNIAFVIIEWRKYNGVWKRLGFVRRDMQIEVIKDCINHRPDLQVPQDTCIEAKSIPALLKRIYGTDPDNDQVKIEAFSEIFNFPASQSPATRSPFPPEFRPVKATLTFGWKTDCMHVKDQPYLVIFKVSDNPSNGPSLATFKSWFITVVGPKPKWKPPVLDLAKRQTKLEWEPYACQDAEKMQIWRRVGEFPFTPDNCETGMPEFLGYELIATVPIKTGNTPVTTYTDTNGGKGLAPGAKYCYRLVAQFPVPRGGESYVSEEVCVDPILADVPVITNVSVEKTDRTGGEIRVRWTRPFEASTIQFPPPYHYDVWRAVGFARGADSVRVNSQGVFINDTTFIDKGLNTEENVYNYSITALTSGNVEVGTSAAASSVRLETISRVNEIELNWSAFVPWSNLIPQHPTHELYRGLEGTADKDFVLVANVDVTANGFTYIDQDLEDDQVYCYRVRTFGGYGNDKIDSVLVNYSQVICAQTGDSIPPCKLLPPLRSTLDFIDCNDYRSRIDTQCDRKTFSNTIFWSKPTDEECRGDISGYNVYAASKVGDTTFVKISENQKDTFYVDTRNLLSYAQCYRIAAVDRSGNIGEKSEILCIDNCPYYELPNVFTPNGDDDNEEFSAYNAREYNPCPPGEELCVPFAVAEKCARFVISVKARFYNRWGKEVYSYEGQISDEVKNIYIDWNGLDSNGNELSSAVYYYVADVTFDTVDPAKKVKTFKGWVHLIR